MDINRIINAANYESFCDFSIIPAENKMLSAGILQRNATIFCKTDFIIELFKWLSHSNYEYNIITHHSDYEINEKLFLLKPKSVKTWYAINATYKHPQLKCIPLGLKTHSGVYVEKVNGETFYKIDWFCENMDRLKQKEKTNQIYCNWGNTNPMRNNIIEVFKRNNLNFVKESGLQYIEYLENMSNYKFVISPPGNGIDCHRTWEAMYMGCIPIVIKNSIYDDWTDLPILQVDSYNDLTMELLIDFSKKHFNYEMLDIAYWKNIIQNNNNL